ncbi:MAG: hypothetical protein ACREEB_12280 [Caulobacteraceae bacterium]
MNGRQFIRRARKWANANQHALSVEKSRGKGGHQIVRLGGRWTTVKTGEIGTGLLAAMLSDLGIPKGEF